MKKQLISILFAALSISAHSLQSISMEALDIDSMPQISHIIDMKLQNDTLFLTYENHEEMGQQFLKAYLYDHNKKKLTLIKEMCRMDNGYYQSYMPGIILNPYGGLELVGKDECKIYNVDHNLYITPTHRHLTGAELKMPFALTSYVTDVSKIDSDRYVFIARKPRGGSQSAFITDFADSTVTEIKKLAYNPEYDSWIANTGKMVYNHSEKTMAFAYRLHPCIEFFYINGGLVKSLKIGTDTFMPETLEDADTENMNIIHFIDIDCSKETLFALYMGKKYNEILPSDHTLLYIFDFEGKKMKEYDIPAVITNLATSGDGKTIISYDGNKFIMFSLFHS